MSISSLKWRQQLILFQRLGGQFHNGFNKYTTETSLNFFRNYGDRFHRAGLAIPRNVCPIGGGALSRLRTYCREASEANADSNGKLTRETILEKASGFTFFEPGTLKLGDPGCGETAPTSADLISLFESTDRPEKVLEISAEFVQEKDPENPPLVTKAIISTWNAHKRGLISGQPSSNPGLVESAEFQRLVGMVMARLRFYNGVQLVRILLSLSRLGVPLDHRVFDLIIRSMKYHVNDLDIISLSILAKCLSGLSSNTTLVYHQSVMALSKALVLIVGDTRLHETLHPKIIIPLMQSLGPIANFTLKVNFEAAVFQIFDGLTHDNAFQILMAFYNMKYIPKSHDLVPMLAKTVLGGVNPFKIWRYGQLSACLQYFRCDDADVLQQFGDRLVDLLTNDITTLTRVVELNKRYFSRIGYHHPGLLNKIIDDFVSISDQDFSPDETIEPRALFNLVHVLSIVNHNEISQDGRIAILNALDTCMDRLAASNTILRTIEHVLTIGLFPNEDLLDRLFNEKYLQALFRTTDWTSHLSETERKSSLFVIQRCMCLEKPDYTLPMYVDQYMPTHIQQQHRTIKKHSVHLADYLSIENTLNGIYGKDCVYRSYEAERNYHIDFLVNFDIEGRPLPVGEVGTCGTGLKRLAGLILTADNCCLHSSRPLGTAAFKIRHLQLLGYSVLKVIVSDWNQLSSDEERVGYIINGVPIDDNPQSACYVKTMGNEY